MATEADLLQHRILMVDTDPTISDTADIKERIWPLFG
jgi:cellulose biosynthesis protein BcsQ